MQMYVKFDQKKADALSRQMAKEQAESEDFGVVFGHFSCFFCAAPMDTSDTSLNVDLLESSEHLLWGERYRQKRDAKHLATPAAEQV